MKQLLSVCFLFIFIINVLTAEPTDQQIQNAAAALEIPFDDLKQFVQTYQIKNIPSGTIRIEAAILCYEYLANELNANIKYKGKIIIIDGKVTEINSNYGGYYVRLEGARKDYIPHTIDVYFKDSELNRLAVINPGQIITVLGLCTGDKGIFSFKVTEAVFTN